MFDEPCFLAVYFLAIYCRGARYLQAGYSVLLAWYQTSKAGKCIVAYGDFPKLRSISRGSKEVYRLN